jgi:hypothetical protein
MELLTKSTSYMTYAHYRNDTNQIFYIGKGSGNRPFNTFNRSKYWKSVAEKHGYSIKILAQWNNENDAFVHEEFLISYFRNAGHPLVNSSSGGRGGSTGAIRTQEFKDQVSARFKGIPKTEETKKKLSLAKLGKSGYIRTQEWKDNISKRLTGKRKSDEHKKKISESKRGKSNLLLIGDLNPSKSIENRLKKSIAMKSFYANGGINPMTGKKRPDLAERNKKRRVN